MSSAARNPGHHRRPRATINPSIGHRQGSPSLTTRNFPVPRMPIFFGRHLESEPGESPALHLGNLPRHGASMVQEEMTGVLERGSSVFSISVLFIQSSLPPRMLRCDVPLPSSSPLAHSLDKHLRQDEGSRAVFRPRSRTSHPRPRCLARGRGKGHQVHVCSWVLLAGRQQY